MHIPAYLYLQIIFQLSLCISSNTAIDTKQILNTNADILKILQSKHEEILDKIKKNSLVMKRKNRVLKNGKNLKAALKPDVWKPKFVLNGTRRIYNGNYASQKYFPFMASVEIFKMFQCGASIIQSDLLITAASCLQLAWNNRMYRENPTFVSVRIGSQFVRIGGELVGVMEIYFYPSYDPKTLQNNIAIMRTIKHINLLNKKQHEAKRIELDSSENSLSVNSEVLILGWGSHSPSNLGNNPIDAHLRDYILPVYTIPECQVIYGKKFVTQTNFCAGLVSSGTGNACNRDIGGPGIVNGYLVGIISFGSPKCGAPNSPTVFTKVGYYTDWIEDIMEQNVTHSKMKTTTLFPPHLPSADLPETPVTENTNVTVDEGLKQDPEDILDVVVLNTTETQIPEETQDKIIHISEDVKNMSEQKTTKTAGRMEKLIKDIVNLAQNREPIFQDLTQIRKDQGTKKIRKAEKLPATQYFKTSTYYVSPICTGEKITRLKLRGRTKHNIKQTTKPSEYTDTNFVYQQIIPIKMLNEIEPNISQKKHVTLHQKIPNSVFSNNHKVKESINHPNWAKPSFLFPTTLREYSKELKQRSPIATMTDGDQSELNQQRYAFPNKASLNKLAYVKKKDKKTYIIPKNNTKGVIDLHKPLRIYGNDINVSQLSDNSNEEDFTTSEVSAESIERETKLIEKLGKLNWRFKDKYHKFNEKVSKKFEKSNNMKISKSHFKFFRTKGLDRYDRNKEMVSEKSTESYDKDESSSKLSANYEPKKVKSKRNYVKNEKNPTDYYMTDMRKFQTRDGKNWSTSGPFDKSSYNKDRNLLILAKTYNNNVKSVNLPARLKSGKKSKTTSKFLRKEVTHLEPITYFHKQEAVSLEQSSGSQENNVQHFKKRADSSGTEARISDTSSLSKEKGVDIIEVPFESRKYIDQLNILLRNAFHNLKNVKSNKIDKKLFMRKATAKFETIYDNTKQNIPEVTIATETNPKENSNQEHMKESLKNLYTLDPAMEIATTHFG